MRFGIRRFIAGTIAAGAIFGAAPSAATAQRGGDAGGVSDQFLQRRRDLELRNELRLARELPTSQRFRVDYGGWFDAYLFLFDDGRESSRTFRQTEMQLWASLSADRGIHEGYLRMRMTYSDWNAGDSFTPNEDDLDGPNLERGWYQFDVAKALRLHGDRATPFELKLKVGRDFVRTGTGFAISLPLDLVQVQTEFADFETILIGARTPASTENIDRSRPVADHSDRNFWIVQERYLGFDRHVPFFYIAWQDDNTSEDPPDFLQKFRYSSRYIGFGSTGELIDHLRYSTEWVLERGRSFGNERFLRHDEIKAWAFDHQVEYLFSHKTKPRLSLEYMFASGDTNRLGSPTNAAGGNRKDHVDHGFVGFGFRDTGLAFAPRLSNIHVWRAGGAFRPFAEVEAAKNLELGTDWFVYAKHRSSAAVSDPFADRRSGYLGWEMDYFANYRVTSDLAFTVRFGSFFPGRAFTDRTTRTFLLTGLSWSF
ncbi:MAG: alginate export family protein [Phycisphaerae bacterium]